MRQVCVQHVGAVACAANEDAITDTRYNLLSNKQVAATKESEDDDNEGSREEEWQGGSGGSGIVGMCFTGVQRHLLTVILSGASKAANVSNTSVLAPGAFAEKCDTADTLVV